MAKVDSSVKKACCFLLVFFVIVFVCIQNTKVHEKTEGVKSEGTDRSSMEETVCLSEIHPPSFEEAFALMYTEAAQVVVCWGHSSENAVMTSSSGYPGFDRPILILGREDIAMNLGSIITLSTEWGDYHYIVQEVGDGVLTDNGDNVISKSNRKEIINFNESREFLCVFGGGKYYLCAMSAGTKIVL